VAERYYDNDGHMLTVPASKHGSGEIL
jgi:hypothetical protein